MTGRKAGPVGRRRAVKAVLLVAVVIAAAPVADAALQAGGAVQAPEAAVAGLDATSVMQAPGAEGVLENLERLADAGAVQSAVPEAIEREVGFPPGARDVRVGASGQVVGYLVDGDPAPALAQLEERLGSRGWTAVPLGGLDGATFLKEDGEYTWALATCTQSGSATCVVIRLKGL